MTEERRANLAAVEAVAERHEKVAAKVRLYDIIKLILLALVTIMVAVVLAVVLWTQDTLRNNSAVNRANLNTLVGCTTPGHPCYERSNGQTKAAVQTIQQVAVYAAYCANTLPGGASLHQMNLCIAAQIAKDPNR